MYYLEQLYRIALEKQKRFTQPQPKTLRQKLGQLTLKSIDLLLLKVDKLLSFRKQMKTLVFTIGSRESTAGDQKQKNMGVKHRKVATP